jgi:hypothetical protein
VSTIDAYVAQLADALRGPVASRRDLLTEARDALVDAADAYERAGLPGAAAQQRAVAEFGPVREIAAAFQPELALGQARRTAWGIGVVLAIQPLLWGVAGLLVDGINGGTAPLYAGIDRVLTWLGTTLTLGALLAVLACGVGSRYLSTQRWPVSSLRLARGIAVGALAACAIMAGLGTAMSLVGDAALVPCLICLAILVWAPLTAVAVAARRCLAACGEPPPPTVAAG